MPARYELPEIVVVFPADCVKLAIGQCLNGIKSRFIKDDSAKVRNEITPGRDPLRDLLFPGLCKHADDPGFMEAQLVANMSFAEKVIAFLQRRKLKKRSDVHDVPGRNPEVRMNVLFEFGQNA